MSAPSRWVCAGNDFMQSIKLASESESAWSAQGWCDEAMGKAKQQRGLKAEKIKKLNTEMEGQEAKRDKLTEETEHWMCECGHYDKRIDDLTHEVGRLTQRGQEPKSPSGETTSTDWDKVSEVQVHADQIRQLQEKVDHKQADHIRQLQEKVEHMTNTMTRWTSAGW